MGIRSTSSQTLFIPKPRKQALELWRFLRWRVGTASISRSITSLHLASLLVAPKHSTLGPHFLDKWSCLNSLCCVLVHLLNNSSTDTIHGRTNACPIKVKQTKNVVH
ncbi:hypothetical protein OG21DRAFT_911225 [Imleria badia]|nr:hypothetical protein OG21DRAFT_911225 [Imleria badia]